MTTPLYVKVGSAMHGPWLDEDDVPCRTMPDVCEAIRETLLEAALAETQAADLAAAAGNYRAAWFALEHIKDLDRLRADLDWSRRAKAPAYRGDEAALEDSMRVLISENLPVDLDYSYGVPERRLYVFEAETEEPPESDES